MPTELGTWATNVKRKVDRVWAPPGGVSLDGESMTAEIGFTVSRDGMLLDTPVVLKEADDPRVAETGLRSIMLSAPFPPLPDSFKEPELYIVYGFSLLR
ncbi:MAG: hypothetical protein GC168_19450 [Candidatus Hydrogenedens sp.]|nr:hypothetical protein [Candidatus Hydrogenedens sp.]